MNYLELFQNLGFPIAVCVVLFTIVIFFFKKQTAMMEKIIHDHDEERKKYIGFYQESNKELVGTVSECTKALNRFSALMVQLNKKLESRNND